MQILILIDCHFSFFFLQKLKNYKIPVVKYYIIIIYNIELPIVSLIANEGNVDASHDGVNPLEAPVTGDVESCWTFQDEGERVREWIDFQDWRDDICLVYGKTYARVRTTEVRSSINRPLLRNHT